jgi:hypothetical protein
MSRATPPTHYQVLRVAPSATPGELRAAYRAAARRAHPDAGGSLAEMRRLNAAWQVLRDPGRRAAYDRSLAETTTGPAESATQEEAPPRPGDPPDRTEEWDGVAEDLLDDHPIGPIRAPEGWWALAPPALLALAGGLFFGALLFGSPALLVFSGGSLFVSIGLFVLAPLRAMARPRN